LPQTIYPEDGGDTIHRNVGFYKTHIAENGIIDTSVAFELTKLTAKFLPVTVMYEVNYEDVSYT
jgi:hypothetical protein